MTKMSDLHQECMQDEAYRAAYATAVKKYAFLEEIIRLRKKVKLSQQKIAEKMKTTQAFVARLESGKGNPSLATLQRYADATDSELVITFVPKSSSSAHISRQEES